MVVNNRSSDAIIPMHRSSLNTYKDYVNIATQNANKQNEEKMQRMWKIQNMYNMLNKTDEQINKMQCL